MHFAIKELVIAISAIIKPNQYIIFVSNFELIFLKIRKEQTLN